MELIQNTIDFTINEDTVITLGKFDGVHRGHRVLMDRILEVSKTGLATVIFTFNMPPNNFIKKQRQPVLLSNKERNFMLEELGIDYLIECPFVEEIARMEPEDFIKNILVKRLRVKHIVIGNDFRFGYKRRGDYRMLQALAQTYGYQVNVMEKAQMNGRDISSTYIKEEILVGNMESAMEMLGYPYFLRGVVVHGKKIGRTIGIPTINIYPEDLKMLPPNGVYITKTKIHGKIYQGVTNIGHNPTIESGIKKVVETYLFHCDEDLYGKEAIVYLYHYRRPELKFDSLEALQNKMQEDITFGKEYFDE
ncbi:MAG TPA: bifunctional riboflavin kinase/FAD synthetase [Candidatus Merdenecus merdavium]|nr:bifunctional riboflavin kinase/FAD synthetase [Candidatus Merdenecus merdavium]